MSSCEKCWNDAKRRPGNPAREYERMLAERDAAGKTCTPEEMAGPDATECPACRRRTVHQWTHVCMACGGR
jgi:hypothetical protein